MQDSLLPVARPARIVVLIPHIHMVTPPSRLAQEVQSILSAFVGIADIRIMDLPVKDTLQQALDLVQSRQVDVFVCTGATGAFLRKHVQTPVVLLPLADYDILSALEQARHESGKVAILNHSQINPQLEALRPLLTVELRQWAYTSLLQAQACVRDAAAGGYKVVIGSSLVTELAEQAGLTGILVTSGKAVRQALEDALEILRSARAEVAKRQRLNALLQHLTDGVLAIDMEARIQSINPALARLLNVSAEWAQGRHIRELDKNLDLEQVLRTGIAEENRILRLGSQTVLANIIPIYENGTQTGVALTCQDTGSVQRADRQIRNSIRASRFVARYQLSQIIGNSAVILSLITQARRYAQTDSTILIQGESGTGKELLAQGIHNASKRSKGPFVAINCAAFPENLLESELFGYEEGAFTGSRKGGKPGLFEIAHTGTIFLDEIGDMPLSLQTRLLRVLQEREVVRLGSTEPTPIDVRVIAATHRNLRARVAGETFREDLYYRLNILRLKLPPLRERKEDIQYITRHILEQLSKRLGARQLPEPVLQSLLPYLESYAWPGNIRELENVMERVMLTVGDFNESAASETQQWRSMMTALFEDDAPERAALSGMDMNLKSLAKTTELVRIRKVIDECDGNLDRACKRLGVSRSTLWRRLKQHS